LKHAPRPYLPDLVWELYRNHVGNKENSKQGLKHLYLRHIAFCMGVVRGLRAWRRWQRSPGGMRYF
jgi:hypothetical protein